MGFDLMSESGSVSALDNEDVGTQNGTARTVEKPPSFDENVCEQRSCYGSGSDSDRGEARRACLAGEQRKLGRAESSSTAQ